MPHYLFNTFPTIKRVKIQQLKICQSYLPIKHSLDLGYIPHSVKVPVLSYRGLLLLILLWFLEVLGDNFVSESLTEELAPETAQLTGYCFAPFVFNESNER